MMDSTKKAIKLIDMHPRQVIIETERLYLRNWIEEDIAPYYSLNQHPKVIEFLREPLTMQQVEDFIVAANQHQTKHGYTLWAVEPKNRPTCIGFIGLNYTTWEAPFTPAVEVGWRLDADWWGKGYATEGAKACLVYGFNTCGLQEIVSFTVSENNRSRRVMEKIGLIRDVNGDFAHPKLEPDHPLSKHVLYRIKKSG